MGKERPKFHCVFFAFLRLANNNEFFLIIFCVHSGMVIKNTQVNIKSWNQKKSYWFGLRFMCWHKVWRYKAHVEKKYIDPSQSDNKKEKIMWIHAVELHIDTKLRISSIELDPNCFIKKYHHKNLLYLFLNCRTEQCNHAPHS